MKRIPATRAIDYLLLDIMPRGLARLGLGEKPQRAALMRPLGDDYCMAVPFAFAAGASVPRRPVAVVCHLFHPEFAQWFVDKLGHTDLQADILISTSSIEKKTAIAEVFASWGRGKVEIRVTPNRGRDIAPKLLAFAEIYDRYDYLLFLHGKKSAHFDFGERWRDYLTDSLAGSAAVVGSILEVFERCPQVGFIFPQHFSQVRSHVAWGENFRLSRRVAWRMGFDLRPDGQFDFPSGSMFWCRPAALRPLLDLGITIDDFPLEDGQIDSTLAHSVERLFLFACEQAGYSWLKVSAAGADATTVSIAGPEDIDRFVATHGFSLLEATKTRR